MVAVPTRGAIRWETVTRLEEARDRTPGLRPIVYQPGNLSVALTRNRIVERFLDTGCETLVMVDDDIVPPPDFIETLDKCMVSVEIAAIPHVMPTPGTPSELMLTAYIDGIPAGLNEGLNLVHAVATGCVAVSRDVVNQIKFRIDNDPSSAVSDDFLFCADARAAGFRIGAWWDGWYCDHVTAVSLAPILESQLRTRQTAGRST